MKTIKYILSSILLISGIYACNDDWDSHYSQEEQVVNNVNIEVDGKAISTQDYLKLTVATGIEFRVPIVQ